MWAVPTLPAEDTCAGRNLQIPAQPRGRAVAHVDKPDVVAFSVESSQVWLVVVFEIMDAHQVLCLRALLQVISNGLRAKRLRLRIIQRGGIQTAVGGANVPFAHDYGHSGGLAQALCGFQGIPAVSVEGKNVKMRHRAAQRLLGCSAGVAHAQVQMMRRRFPQGCAL